MKRFGEFSVEILSSNQYDGYTERILSIGTDKVKKIKYMHIMYQNTISFTPVVCQVSAGDTVSDTELEPSGQVFQPTDCCCCGGGYVQGAA